MTKTVMKVKNKIEVTMKENLEVKKQCQLLENKDKGNQQAVSALTSILQARQTEYSALQSHYTLVENAIKGEPF
jgi:hypothetical protein